MSISLTAAQAAALARVAESRESTLRLHQVAGAADLLVTIGGQGEPNLLIRADGAVEPLEAAPVDSRS